MVELLAGALLAGALLAGALPLLAGALPLLAGALRPAAYESLNHATRDRQRVRSV